MEQLMYCIFCAMCIGGALGVILLKNFVNSAMSMLVSMLGTAGLMILMYAYFPAFIVLTVYGGAIMVLFVFVVMFIGDEDEKRHWGKKLALAVLWAALCAMIGAFVPERLPEATKAVIPPAGEVANAQNYGVAIISDFALELQIVGIMLLAAMVGVIVVAKPNAAHKIKSDML